MREAVGEETDETGHHREAGAEDDGGDFRESSHDGAYQYDGRRR